MKIFIVCTLIVAAVMILGFIASRSRNFKPLEGEELKAAIIAMDEQRAREAQEPVKEKNIFPDDRNSSIYALQAPCRDNGCRVIKVETFGCSSKAAFDRVITFTAQGDKVAAAKGIADWCSVLSRGDIVYLNRYASGVAEIHLQGSTESLWVMPEVVSSK
jgi:hypothetical protein